MPSMGGWYKPAPAPRLPQLERVPVQYLPLVAGRHTTTVDRFFS